MIFNFFIQIYLKRQRKRSTMENQYPSCAQGSEPNERFIFMLLSIIVIRLILEENSNASSPKLFI